VLRTFLLTALALVAFAANSILCRLALRGEAIDPASFSAIRLAAGALTLGLLVRWSSGPVTTARGSAWLSAGWLFLYAIPFAFAYVNLDVGTGALLLFGAVQVTMLVVASARGQHPRLLQWVGLVAAMAGLIYLVRPGLSAPDPIRALLMIVAGVAWGVYSLRGHGSAAPLRDTAQNFIRAVPLAIAVCLLTWPLPIPQPLGILWAGLSGALASGIGYALWYTALGTLSTVTAAVVQLAVPILAALGGVLLLGEHVTTRLAIAALLVLSGIGLTILNRPGVPPAERA
jgi:drug/metabolite transporter (DMT)-like permease